MCIRKYMIAEPTKLYGGKIIENICQALAGELCKEAIERAEQSGLQCVAQIHDEIIAIVLDNEVEKGVITLKRAMEQSPSWLPSMRLRSEVGHGKSWDNAKV